MDDPDGEQDDPADNEEDKVSAVDVALSGSDDSSNCNEEEEDAIPAITHSVIFKCIGCTKVTLLALASQKIQTGETVPVKLEKQPSNPYDCNAIAFMCHAEKDWEQIGYVVSEALTDTNEAISNNKIL